MLGPQYEPRREGLRECQTVRGRNRRLALAEPGAEPRSRSGPKEKGTGRDVSALERNGDARMRGAVDERKAAGVERPT